MSPTPCWEPGDKIFGTAILEGQGKLDVRFRFRGDLLLGVIDGGGDISINGVEISPLKNLAMIASSIWVPTSGPNIDLTISRKWHLRLAACAVPEPSTWAMLLLGFAGLGFVGYRQTRRAKPQTA